jgi:hypothetical protein
MAKGRAGTAAKKQCEVCGIMFPCKPSHQPTRRCCSRACQTINARIIFQGERNPNWRGGFKRDCVVCGKPITSIPCFAKTKKYCSRACQGTGCRGTQIGEKSPRWKGGAKASQQRYRAKQPKRPRRVSRRKCKICGKGPIRKGRTMHPGCRPSPRFGQWLMTCIDCGITKRVHAKLTQTRCKPCQVKRVFGADNPNWKGGITPTHRKIRNSPEYAAWRIAVFTRDNYTCVFCGQKGGKLNADHIKSFAKHPDLRLELTNGRTLCVPCHKTTETYLAKGRRKIVEPALRTDSR